ncbi:hypothetical protein NEIG_01820 [Nematocida sp. ERTm5]|nr:hypothetical protein NEIG_01820 [Nematocida sp. ERTm5]
MLNRHSPVLLACILLFSILQCYSCNNAYTYNNPLHLKVTIVAESQSIPKWKIKQAVNILRDIYRNSGLGITISCQQIKYAHKHENSPNNYATDIASDSNREIDGVDLFNGLKTIADTMRRTNGLITKTSPIFFLHLEENPSVYGASVENGIFIGNPIAVCTVKPEDTPKEIGETMAHELAHLLGAKHDGDGNGCMPSGYLMETIYTKSDELKIFSTCSKSDIKNKLVKNEIERSKVDT